MLCSKYIKIELKISEGLGVSIKKDNSRCIMMSSATAMCGLTIPAITLCL